MPATTPSPAPSPALPTASDKSGDRTFYVFNAVLSTVALAVIAWLLMARRAESGADLRFLPPLNAALNGLAATLLSLGWVAIRRGQRRVHQYLMVSAFAASGLFLVGYLTYHYVHGDSRFGGEGLLRGVYLAILASHVLLSMVLVPMAFTVLYLAARGRFARHLRLARWTLPIWLYVSVTGVLIWFMLHGLGYAIS